jgi:hypothetical protein
VTGLCAIALSGCMTDKKTADAEDPASSAELAAAGPQPVQGPRMALTARQSLTTNTRYVDPLVSTSGRHQQQAKQQQQATTPAATAAGAQQMQTAAPASSATAFPPAPAQPAQSLSGLATQPTGVRAGSFSIFSSTAPPPSAMPQAAPTAPAQATANSPVPETTGTVPVGRNFSATSGSVFTPRQPLAPTTCPTDKSGRPVNC